MPSPNKAQEFCRQVCSFVKYKRVHHEITEELQNHIEDHQEQLIEIGMNQEEAEQQAVQAMGDPEEIGRELDKQHRPLVEWMLSITNITTVLGLFYLFGVFLFVVFIALTSLGSLTHSVDPQKVVYTQKLIEKQKAGAITYQLRKVTVTNDNTILVDYATYGNNIDILLRGWSSPSLGAYDEAGKPYNSKGSSMGGLYRRGQIIVENYDLSQQDSIRLKVFSYYGDVEFHIPLQEVR